MAQPVTILVIDSNDERRALIEQALSEVENAELHGLRLDDPQGVLATISSLEPGIAVIGASGTEDGAFEFAEELSNGQPGVGLVVASGDDSAELVMRAMRAGADEFIRLPAEPQEIQAAFARILRRKGKQVGAGEGYVITVFSAKGGCGATMLATNLATYMAGELPADAVAVVDLNLQLGNVGTLMDVRPRFTVADAAKEIDRLDKALLKSFMASHPSGAAVLACASDPEEAEAISGEHIGAILDMLKTMYQFVIVDTVHVFTDHSLAALDHSDTILLVTDMMVPSIRNTQRCMSVFKQLSYPEENIHLVVNRYYRGTSVSLKDVRRVLEMPLWWLVPNDTGTVRAAVDGGLSVDNVAPRSQIAKSLRGLARDLAGLPAIKEPRAGLGKMMSSLIGK